ncbi:MAG TPA: hypothetical protein ENN66_07005 [Proteobacteria bacterium]|nr:hypothetical protein [Pseudomonadota bacterium]
MKNFSFLFALIFSLLLGGMLLLSCGKRAEPLPALSFVPPQIEDLQVEVLPGRRLLSWTIPSALKTGDIPDELIYVVKAKTVYTGQEGCLFCDEGFSDILKLKVKSPAPAFVRGNSLCLPLPELEINTVGVFALLLRSQAGWEGPLSNKVAAAYLPEIMPPESVQVLPSASSVELSWRPPALPMTETATLSYRVYRASGADDLSSYTLVSREPVVEPRFYDVGLRDWDQYRYAVTALITMGTSSFESRFSESVMVAAGDFTPPEPPESLTAFYFEGSVQLLWSLSSSADVLGYNVYRRDLSSGIESRIAVLSQGVKTFTDCRVMKGQQFSYRVTAFDNSMRRNESLSTDEVNVDLR